MCNSSDSGLILTQRLAKKRHWVSFFPPPPPAARRGGVGRCGSPRWALLNGGLVPRRRGGNWRPAHRPPRPPPRAQAATAGATQSASAAMAGAPTLVLLLLGHLLAAAMSEAQVSAGWSGALGSHRRTAAARVGVRGSEMGRRTARPGDDHPPTPASHPGPASEPGTRGRLETRRSPEARGPSRRGAESGRPTEPLQMLRHLVDQPRTLPCPRLAGSAAAWAAATREAQCRLCSPRLPWSRGTAPPGPRMEAADTAGSRLGGGLQGRLGSGGPQEPGSRTALGPGRGTTVGLTRGQPGGPAPQERVGRHGCMMTFLHFRKWDLKAPLAPKGHLGSRARMALM